MLHFFLWTEDLEILSVFMLFWAGAGNIKLERLITVSKPNMSEVKPKGHLWPEVHFNTAPSFHPFDVLSIATWIKHSAETQ